MHSENFTRQRLTRAIRDRVRPAVTTALTDLEVAAWTVGGEPVPPPVAIPGLDGGAFRADYRPFALGGSWGRPWDTTWFRLRGTIPPAARGERLEVMIDFGWEAALPGFQAEARAHANVRP